VQDFIGRSLGRYDILKQLGEGGMAIVYRAHDTRLERDVAIKVIRRGAFPPDQIDQILKRFEREAKALAKLSHPNIVRILDYGDQDGSPFLVMEYLPGGTLKHQLDKPMPWKEALQILLPIAEALEYAHHHNIFHRDIKPSNILLTESGQPMLTDFGISKILEVQESTGLTSSGMALGTPEYMAPEQWTGQTSARSDIYSLGVVFYEMVTGRRPYEADTPAAILIKQASDPLPHPKTYIPNLPEAVERTILRALAKKPGDRYQDISGFIDAMERLLEGKDLSKPFVASKVSTPSRSSGIPAKAPTGPARADKTEDEFGTRTEAVTFEEPADLAPRPATKSFPVFWIATCAVVILLLGFGGFLIYAFTTGPDPTATEASATNSPDPGNTADSTETTSPTDGPQPTDIPPPTETLPPVDTPLPTDAPPPTEPLRPLFTSSSSAYCRDLPSSDADTHVDFVVGVTWPVIGKIVVDSGMWILLDVEVEGTRTDCCWVSSDLGTLNVSLNEVRTVPFIPDRLDCSALK
jgi:serine/threonine protein kinase